MNIKLRVNNLLFFFKPNACKLFNLKLLTGYWTRRQRKRYGLQHIKKYRKKGCTKSILMFFHKINKRFICCKCIKILALKLLINQRRRWGGMCCITSIRYLSIQNITRTCSEFKWRKRCPVSCYYIVSLKISFVEFKNC